MCCLIVIVLALIFLFLAASLIVIPVFSGYRYNSWMVPPFVAGQLFICFGFIWMMEETLYKEVKQVRGASAEQFAEAVYTNLFWNNFSNKKATLGKGLLFLFVIFVIFAVSVLICFIAIPGVIESFNRQEKFDIQIIFSLLAGSFPAVFYLMIFQNNPIRWLLAVRKYEQGKVVFTEEEEEKARE